MHDDSILSASGQRRYQIIAVDSGSTTLIASTSGSPCRSFVPGAISGCQTEAEKQGSASMSAYYRGTDKIKIRLHRPTSVGSMPPFSIPSQDGSMTL